MYFSFVLGDLGRIEIDWYYMMYITYYKKQKIHILPFNAEFLLWCATLYFPQAMTSGAIAGFLDVAFNFNTQALLDDNLIGKSLALCEFLMVAGSRLEHCV